MCVCVSQQLTSFVFALLALSHSRDVLKQPRGRHTYSCWQLRRTRGRKWKVLPSFHTPATSHTDSATNHDECVCLCVCVCVCACGKQVLTCVCLCIGLHIMPSKNNFAFLHEMFEISSHIYTICSVAVCCQSIRETLFSRVQGRIWPVWPFTHPTSCSVQLLLAREVRGDTIAALIDRVNKYSVLVPVRCSLPSNTLSVCFSLQSGTVTSCLPHTAFVN